MKHHIYIVTIGLILIGIGMINMFDFDVAPSKTVISVSELEKGRADSSHILHTYSNDENDIYVYLTLNNEPQSGVLIYTLPRGAKIDSDYFEGTDAREVSVHFVDSGDNTNVYVKYSNTGFVNSTMIFKASIPANIKTVMGRYLFKLPSIANIQFPVSYSFHSQSSANIVVNGTQAVPAESISVGLSWDNLAKVKEDTTVSVGTPHLVRSSQISLVLGAILIAIGINLLTTHAYESIRKHS